MISDSLPPPSLGLSRCSDSLILHVSSPPISRDRLSLSLSLFPSPPQSDWVFMSSRCGILLPYPLYVRERERESVCVEEGFLTLVASTAPFSLREDKLFSGLVFCPSKVLPLPTSSLCGWHFPLPPSLPPCLPAQLPRCDLEKMACLVLYYGGRTQLRLDPAVTHLVTMDTTGVSPPSLEWCPVFLSPSPPPRG